MFSVCSTRPVQGAAKYSSRWRAVFHPNVATRPSGEILSGDSADVYFARAESVLEREGLDPIVTMEVFARQNAVLCGIDEAKNLIGHVLATADPAETRVDAVMTADPLTVGPQEEIQTCMLLMRRHGFRHLPICEGKLLKGVISLRDLLLHDLNEKDDEVRMMRAYIQAPPQL